MRVGRGNGMRMRRVGKMEIPQEAVLSRLKMEG
jgi:translation elongation factor EF-4